MINFDTEDKDKLYNILTTAINNGDIGYVISLYNDEMLSDTKYGFVDLRENFANHIQKGMTDLEHFPYKFHHALDLSIYQYIYTDKDNVIYGATLAEITNILTDCKFIDTIINHVSEYNDVDYFTYRPLTEWLKSKIFFSNLDVCDIVIFEDGTSGIFVEEKIIDFQTVTDIINNYTPILMDVSDFDSNGEAIYSNFPNAVKIIDFKTKKVKWHN